MWAFTNVQVLFHGKIELVEALTAKLRPLLLASLELTCEKLEIGLKKV